MSLRFKRRPTTKLAEVINDDLLTAQEKLIMNQSGGFYCLSDEQAYFRTSGDKAQMSIAEFERHLRSKVHPHFRVIYNPKKTRAHEVEGHQIIFHVSDDKGFVPLCKVGKSAETMIPANSVGKKVLYKGAVHKKTGGDIMDETAILYRGWVAAEEACKAFVQDAMQNGIKPDRTMDYRDWITLREMGMQLGGSYQIQQVFNEVRTKNLVETQVAEAKAEMSLETSKPLKDANEFTQAIGNAIDAEIEKLEKMEVKEEPNA